MFTKKIIAAITAIFCFTLAIFSSPAYSYKEYTNFIHEEFGIGRQVSDHSQVVPFELWGEQEWKNIIASGKLGYYIKKSNKRKGYHDFHNFFSTGVYLKKNATLGLKYLWIHDDNYIGFPIRVNREIAGYNVFAEGVFYGFTGNFRTDFDIKVSPAWGKVWYPELGISWFTDHEGDKATEDKRGSAIRLSFGYTPDYYGDLILSFEKRYPSMAGGGDTLVIFGFRF
ncbi:MAG: hypothetical protein V1860_02480 [bacterium]